MVKLLRDLKDLKTTPVPDLPKLRNSRTYPAVSRKHAPTRTRGRRKRTGADEFLEELDDFRLTGISLIALS